MDEVLRQVDEGRPLVLPYLASAVPPDPATQLLLADAMTRAGWMPHAVAILGAPGALVLAYEPSLEILATEVRRLRAEFLRLEEANARLIERVLESSPKLFSVSDLQGDR